MLSQLHIDNIAVIEHADISFTSGLNVLTGETGAGKSIIIDSLNAVLGSRTSKDLVRRGSSGALVTAVFETSAADGWLRDNDIAPDCELILQRKILPDGKTSCRVNGVPVTAAQLRDLASALVDIHGQNDGLRLLDEKSHLAYLDAFGVSGSVREEYAQAFATYSAVRKEIDSLTMDDEEKERLSDTLRYRISELEKADLKQGEYDSLTARRELLRNSEKLREALDAALGLLSDGDENSLSMAQNAQYYADRASRYAPDLSDAAGSVKEAILLLTDASETLSDFRESLDFSPEEYDELESRISLIDRLRRKYSREEDELIAFLDECRAKLGDIEYSEDRIIKLKKDLKLRSAECASAAARLSAERKAAGAKLESRITSELKDLNMPSVKFRVYFEPKAADPGFDSTGADSVRFLMAANAGEEPGRISRIASGGELSRIMLALKNVFAEHDTVETMVFDEIDTGVSGIAAQRVAEKLYSVACSRQVMCVSHLPQIAAMADSQYLVAKSESDGKTSTEVKALMPENRKYEIARLYGGDNVTETTLAAAQEQINSAQEYKRGM